MVIIHIFGLLPGTQWPRCLTYLYGCYTGLVLGLLFLQLVTQVGAAVQPGNSIHTIASNACLMLEWLSGIIKVMMFLRNQSKVQDLITKLSAMHLNHCYDLPERKAILAKAAKRGNVISIIFLLMGLIAVVSWVLHPLIIGNPPEVCVLKDASGPMGNYTIENAPLAETLLLSNDPIESFTHGAMPFNGWIKNSRKSTLPSKYQTETNIQHTLQTPYETTDTTPGIVKTYLHEGITSHETNLLNNQKDIKEKALIAPNILMKETVPTLPEFIMSTIIRKAIFHDQMEDTNKETSSSRTKLRNMIHIPTEPIVETSTGNTSVQHSISEMDSTYVEIEHTNAHTTMAKKILSKNSGETIQPPSKVGNDNADTTRYNEELESSVPTSTLTLDRFRNTVPQSPTPPSVPPSLSILPLVSPSLPTTVPLLESNGSIHIKFHKLNYAEPVSPYAYLNEIRRKNSNLHLRFARKAIDSNIPINQYDTTLSHNFPGKVNICTSRPIMPAEGWFPFEQTTSPGYEQAYCFQIIVIFLGYITTSVLDSFYMTIMVYLAAQLKLLNLSILRVSEKGQQMYYKTFGNKDIGWKRMRYTLRPGDKNLTEEVTGQAGILENNQMEAKVYQAMEDKIGEALVECIKHHRDIIKYVAQLQDIISFPMLTQFVISMFAICLTLFSTAVTSEGDTITTIKYATYLIAIFSELLLFCFCGDDIISESEELQFSVYSCGWPDYSESLKKNLRFLMLRVQQPLTFRAGKFYVMSKHTFLQMIQASYSVFTVLTGVNDKEE